MTRPSFARPLAAFAAAAILVASCGGGGPTTAPTTGPETVAPATQAPTVAPATQAPASLGPGFSMPSVDKELEALLPDEIGGVTVVKSSVGGEALVAGAGGDDFQRVLTALGKSPSDLTAGIGGTPKVILLAFRIKGVDAATFFDAFLDAAAQEPDAQLTDVTIAGKPAKRFTDASATTLYLYFVEGAIVTVSLFAPDDAILNEIFQKLP